MKKLIPPSQTLENPSKALHCRCARLRNKFHVLPGFPVHSTSTTNASATGPAEKEQNNSNRPPLVIDPARARAASQTGDPVTRSPRRQRRLAAENRQNRGRERKNGIPRRRQPVAQLRCLGSIALTSLRGSLHAHFGVENGHSRRYLRHLLFC